MLSIAAGIILTKQSLSARIGVRQMMGKDCGKAEFFGLTSTSHLTHFFGLYLKLFWGYTLSIFWGYTLRIFGAIPYAFFGAIP